MQGEISHNRREKRVNENNNKEIYIYHINIEWDLWNFDGIRCSETERVRHTNERTYSGDFDKSEKGKKENRSLSRDLR